MLFAAILGALWLGYYLREILDVLKRLDGRIELFNKLSDKPKPQSNPSFAEPMTRAEVIAMLEQERVDALNGRQN